MPERSPPGLLLARGVGRCLRARGFAPLAEFVPAPGRRVDVIALGPLFEIWIVECKSGRGDFTSDRKWGGYLEWCDRFFWAVDADFPDEILPEQAGLIRADAYDAEIVSVHGRQHRFDVAGVETVVKVLEKFCVTGHRALLICPRAIVTSSSGWSQAGEPEYQTETRPAIRRSSRAIRSGCPPAGAQLRAVDSHGKKRRLPMGYSSHVV